jgi:hypothetical protein
MVGTHRDIFVENFVGNLSRGPGFTEVFDKVFDKGFGKVLDNSFRQQFPTKVSQCRQFRFR